ncbi:MAG: ATPase domain-containing protein [Candidatus Bathyarchaeia archaeon]
MIDVSGELQVYQKVTSTGADGLDAVLKGGFPKGSLIVLAGPPGSGKTIFSAQFLYRGAVDHGERGLYVSFGEGKESFYENMRGFDFDFEELERRGLFRFLDMITVQEQAVPSLLEIIVREAEKIKAERLVLDSFSALAQSFREPFNVRIVVHIILSKLIRSMGCTTIMIEEVPCGSERIGLGMEEFVADGVIWLKSRDMDGHRLRELEIIKLRGAKLKEPRLIFTLNGGFTVFPPFQFTLPEKPKRFQPIPDPPGKYSTGSITLDKALDGGLPQGSVTLVEVDEKVSRPMYHLLIAPIGDNFVLHGRGTLSFPSSGVDPELVRNMVKLRGITEEEFRRYIKIIMPRRIASTYASENIITVKGENWAEDIREIINAFKQLEAETGQPILLLIGADVFTSLYGEKESEQLLNVIATLTRTTRSVTIVIIKAGQRNLAVKLSAIADVYLRLTRRRGTLLLYGVKPRTGLYTVNIDNSMGYQIPKLTPII